MLRFIIPTTAVDHPHAVHHHVPGVPRDPDRHRSGGRATSGSTRGPRQAKIQQYKEVNGLIGTPPEQYFHWLGHFVTGNWGNSIKGNRPVWPEMKNALANTLVLGIVATVVGVTIGLGIGILSALRPHSKFDTAATTGAFVGFSIPPFVSAVLLQLFFAVYITKWLGLDKPFLPTSGIYPPGHTGFDPVLRAKHLILPVTVVAIQTIAVYSRYMRASLLEVKNSRLPAHRPVQGHPRAARSSSSTPCATR